MASEAMTKLAKAMTKLAKALAHPERETRVAGLDVVRSFLTRRKKTALDVDDLRKLWKGTEVFTLVLLMRLALTDRQGCFTACGWRTSPGRSMSWQRVWRPWCHC